MSLDSSRKIAGPPLFPFIRAGSRNCSAPRGMRRIGWRERGERWWWWSDAGCPVFFYKKFSSFLFCLRIWSQLRVDTGSTEFGAACAQLGHSARSTMAALCCYACTHGQRTPPPFLQRIQNPRWCEISSRRRTIRMDRVGTHVKLSCHRRAPHRGARTETEQPEEKPGGGGGGGILRVRSKTVGIYCFNRRRGPIRSNKILCRGSLVKARSIPWTMGAPAGPCTFF
jgi:hypothetical protein